MRVLHDYLLVKEVVANSKIEGTSLNVKYDDTERFMIVEVVESSDMLGLEYAKYYNIKDMDFRTMRELVSRIGKPGTQLIINRVAKTPYKDGLYFISFKDIIAIENYEPPKKEEDNIPEGQMTIYDYM